MTSAPQYVTLVVQGGTPVRLADQKGAPYPTTGRGGLVFSDGPVINNPTFIGRVINVSGDTIGVATGSVTAPSIYFGNVTSDDGFYSVGLHHVNVGLNGVQVADFSSTGLNIAGSIQYSAGLIGGSASFTGTVTAPTPAYPSNNTNIATTAYVTTAIATSVTGAFLPLSGGTLTGHLTGTTATFSGPITTSHVSTPATPADGMIWTTTAGMFVRINGVTKTVTLT